MNVQRLLSYCILALVLALLSYFAFWHDVGFNSSYHLKKAYNRYESLTNVHACREAYDFLASSAKQNHSYDEYKKGCDDNNDYSENISIKDVVFINKGFAKLHLKRDVEYLGKTASRDYSQAWINEHGQWKRDWPN